MLLEEIERGSVFVTTSVALGFWIKLGFMYSDTYNHIAVKCQKVKKEVNTFSFSVAP